MKSIFILILCATLLCGAPSERDNTVIVPLLKGLVFVSSPQAFKKGGVTTDGVSLVGVPMLNRGDFYNEVAMYLGKPITFKALTEITSKVSEFYKRQNHPLVDVVAPEQDVSGATIQIVVNEFRVGEVRVQGNRWFSEKVIAAPIKLHHGDTIDTDMLLNQMDAVNSSPYRRVDVEYEPSSQPGFTDLVLHARDRFPVSAYSGFDNSGTAITGRSRWNMGASWGNALGRGQLLSYQFSASSNLFTGGIAGGASFLSNSLTWSMPLFQKDSLSIFGSYQKAVPNVGSDFGLAGKSGQASIRYNLVLHRTEHFNQTIQAGYDFKTTNNNLAFGGVSVSRNSTEIDQFPAAYAASLMDRWGSSSFTTTVVFSPGGLSPDNHSNNFQPGPNQSGIQGAQSRYTYWRTDFTRLTKLPAKAVYAFRFLGQTSTTNLLYTEKLSVGGPDLLRGYDPNSVFGDRGIVVSNELRTPAFKLFPEKGLGEIQFYIFWDYGHLQAAHAYDDQVNSLAASSVGSGVRYELRSNLTAHMSYGRALIQLPNTNAAARNSFIDLALTVAY